MQISQLNEPQPYTGSSSTKLLRITTAMFLKRRCAGVEVARGAELAGQSSPDLETAAFQLWLQHGMPLCSPGLEHECYSLAGKPMIRAPACKTLLQRSRWLFHTL